MMSSHPHDNKSLSLVLYWNYPQPYDVATVITSFYFSERLSSLPKVTKLSNSGLRDCWPKTQAPPLLAFFSIVKKYILENEPFLSEEFYGTKYVHSVVQPSLPPIPTTFSFSRNDTPYPLNANFLFPSLAPGHHHSAVCLCEFNSSRYLI